MASKTAKLEARFYPDYKSEDDIFRDILAGYLPVAGLVLDAGCGSGRFFHDMKNKSKGVVGLDITADVAKNPSIDYAVIGDLERIPLADASVSLCISKYVLEHVKNAEATFAEVARVLAPGGVFIFHTPNRFHYVPTIARLLPHSFHKKVNAARGRDEADTFHTFYRANSRRAVYKLSRRAGLDVEAIRMIESKPNYLVFSRAAYMAGVAYERLVNRFAALAGLRVNMIGVLRKPGPAPGNRA